MVLLKSVKNFTDCVRNMIKGRATLEATKKYSQKNTLAKQDFFVDDGNFCISSIGFGTFVPEPYKEENYEFSYEDAVVCAVQNGSNIIDTASNYRYGQSEKEIAKALQKLAEQGFKREEIILCSKGGFLQLSYPFPDNPYVWIQENIINNNLAKECDIAIDQHCMTPEYIAWSLEQSLQNLNVECIDIYYLHNIEMQLGFGEKADVLKRVKAVFEVLEKAKQDGKIGYYGIASWNAFLNEPKNIEYLSIKEMVDIAKAVGGNNHGLRYIQMPYNLAKPHAYVYQNQEIDGLFYTPIQAAKKLGLSVITSSSLLQMNLFKGTFSDNFRSLIGLEYASDIHRALQFARSALGVSCALVGTKSTEHVMHNLEMQKFDKTNKQAYEQIFRL